METQHPKILYIGGYGRSGSTIFERILDQFDSIISVGELRLVWLRGFHANYLCGCGKPFRDCEFWKSVIDEAFGGIEYIDLQYVIHLMQSVCTAGNIPLMVSRFRPSSYDRDARKLADILANFYHAIQRVSGSNIIIDSSKSPAFLIFLSRFTNLNPYVLHMVRDSRGVAFSWTKKRLRPDAVEHKLYINTTPPALSSVRWMAQNLVTECARRLARDYIQIRYEDFVKKPRQAVSDALRLLGEDLNYPKNLQHIADRTVTLDGATHTISGNPSKFQTGSIPIQEDIQWKKDMRSCDKLLVSLLTFPGLMKYGYNVFPFTEQAAEARTFKPL